MYEPEISQEIERCRQICAPIRRNHSIARLAAEGLIPSDCPACGRRPLRASLLQLVIVAAAVFVLLTGIPAGTDDFEMAPVGTTSTGQLVYSSSNGQRRVSTGDQIETERLAEALEAYVDPVIMVIGWEWQNGHFWNVVCSNGRESYARSSFFPDTSIPGEGIEQVLRYGPDSGQKVGEVCRMIDGMPFECEVFSVEVPSVGWVYISRCYPPPGSY